MYDPREQESKREWQSWLNALQPVEPKPKAELFDARLFMAIWRTITPWGLKADHARAIYDAIKGWRTLGKP